MKRYQHTHRFLVAVDCIIFGFDDEGLKLLLIHRGFDPERDKWSLMGGFVGDNESLEDAAARVLRQLTGLSGVYMEQLHAFGNPNRDPVERTLSVAFYALINIHEYEQQLSQNFRPEWVTLSKVPPLIFDHRQMVEKAKEQLRIRAASRPVLFELLPERFTLPRLQDLYESVYDKTFDKRNFTRKILSSGLLVKTALKDKESSKKGAYYYTLNKRKSRQLANILNPLIPLHHTV